MCDHRKSRLRPPPEIDTAMNAIFQTLDPAKVDLFRHFKAVAHLLSLLSGQYHKGTLSVARIQLLVWLMVERSLGNTKGISPSELSNSLRVSRNTVSALLSSLEEQGLIERELHPSDRRQFLIRITEAGEALVSERAPEFARFVENLFDPLTTEEQATLLTLLDKVLCRLIERAKEMGVDLPHHPQPERGTVS